jgi:hypothetical protein
MASDPTLPLRQAVIQRLRADPDLIAIVPASRVYGERSPSELTWPFVRYGQSLIGQAGGTLPIHIFSKQNFTDETAEIADAIVESLDDASLDLGDGRKAVLKWPEQGGTQIIADGAEADAWHGIVRFEVTIPRLCS